MLVYGVLLMDTVIDIRYIPAWMSKAIDHYGADYKEFESIVSRHDLGLYGLANNLIRAMFMSMNITDFQFVDATLGGVDTYSQDDMLFALYGPMSEGKTVADFNLGNFVIVPDRYDGIIVIEKPEKPEQSLLKELLEAVALYRGKDAAYRSTCFKRYLTLVNKNTIISQRKMDQVNEGRAERFHRLLKEKLGQS